MKNNFLFWVITLKIGDYIVKNKILKEIKNFNQFI